MRRLWFTASMIILALTLSSCVKSPVSHVLEETQDTYSTLPTHTQLKEPHSSPSLGATQLSLDEATFFAIRHNPKLQTQLEQLGVARADLYQSGLLQNPETDLAVRKREGSSGHNVEFETLMSVSDLWQVPFRKQAATRAYEAMQHDIIAAILDTIHRTKKAYIDCLYAEHDLQLLEAIVQDYQELHDQIQLRYEHGYHTKLDLALTEARVSQWHATYEEARAHRDNQYARLEGILGLSHDEERRLTLTQPFYITDIADMPLFSALREQADTYRPEIQAQHARITQYQRHIRYEQSRVFPHVGFGASFEQELNGNHLRGPALSFEIPLFDANQAQISRTEYLKRHAEKMLDSIHSDIDLAITLARNDLNALQNTLRQYQDNMLPRISEGLAYAREYAHQKRLTVPTMIETRQSLHATQRTYLRSVRDAWHNLADLERAVGIELRDQLITTTQEHPKNTS